MASMLSIPPPQALFRQGHPAHLRAHQEFIATPQAGGHIQRAGLEAKARADGAGEGNKMTDQSIVRVRLLIRSFLSLFNQRKQH